MKAGGCLPTLSTQFAALSTDQMSSIACDAAIDAILSGPSCLTPEFEVTFNPEKSRIAAGIDKVIFDIRMGNVPGNVHHVPSGA